MTGYPGHVSCDAESPAEWVTDDDAEAGFKCCAPAAKGGE